MWILTVPYIFVGIFMAWDPMFITDRPSRVLYELMCIISAAWLGAAVDRWDTKRRSERNSAK
jgi:Ca2+/H+ antiporter